MKTELAPLFFPVAKVPTVSIMKNDAMEFNSDNSYAIVATIPTATGTREKALNFCSDIYALIENKDVLLPLIPVLEEKFHAVNIKVKAEKHSQFTVRVAPVVPGFSPRTSIVRPSVTFTNSYDGKLLAQAKGGLVRYFTKSDGTVETTYSTFVPGVSFSYTFKHNSEHIYSMTAISELFKNYVAEFSLVEGQIALMQNTMLKRTGPKTLGPKLVSDMAKGTLFPLKQIEDCIDRIMYEAEVLDEDVNLWTVYNAMNYIIETSENALSTKMRSDSEAKVYANVYEYCQALQPKKQLSLGLVVDKVLSTAETM